MEKNDLKKMLTGVNTVAVTCRQFGDTGKGKFVDLFAQWADIIARGTGGDNAGHSIQADGKELVVHVIPSGILYDSLGKINVIGSGTVVYPKSVVKELAVLREMGLSYNNLRIAYNAKLIMPTEIVLDRVRESISGKGKIGSTGKGIGPAYADFVDRQGLMINDMLNLNVFLAKLKRHLEYKRQILKNYDSELLKSIMEHDHLEDGLYYDSREIFNLDAIYGMYMSYGLELKEFVSDTDSFVKSSLGKKKILLEGAQGDMLSINRGTYPFTTSSDCTVAGLAQGVGLKENDVDLSLGIIKGFYMTRVGGGPFPTELGGAESDDWCNGGQANRISERFLYSEATTEDKQEEFRQGISLRIAGNEYGSTTQRPRRTGWLDLPLLRYVLGFNSPDIILTKLDILNDYKEIKICNCYKYEGPEVNYAGKIISKDDLMTVAIPDAAIMKYCRPVYTKFAGWESNLSDCHDYKSLPENFKKILEFIVKETGINPRIISIGPDRNDTIFI